MTPTNLTSEWPQTSDMFGDGGATSRSLLDDLMTAEELAKYLKVPKSTVLDYQRRGFLPSVNLGKHVRFVRTDVESALRDLAQRGRDRQRVPATVAARKAAHAVTARDRVRR